MEKKAMVGERWPILWCVGDLRRYRAAAKKLIDSRHIDGEVDAFAMQEFLLEVENIEGTEGRSE
jgi:hypothetical protein